VFFRASEFEGYRFLEAPETLAVISSAADRYLHSQKILRIRNPRIVKTSEGYKLHSEAKDRVFKKIKSIFEIAKEREHDSLVLSAFGCGAFGNPPQHIAELFKQAIETFGYLYDFKYIAFAIIGT
jgi:uncharacterized protein (TIGR02452 family)